MFRRSPLKWSASSLCWAAALLVSLAPLQAQDARAKLLVQKGQVSLLKGGYMEPLAVGQTIQTQQVIVTGADSYAQFQISDGSTFEVYANSRVVFRQTPGDWQHLLNVFMGRVKVFIQHLPGVANPNNVSSPTAVISVRGTIFDVVVEDEDGTTLVSVDEGVVDVRNMTAAGNSATLRQGDSIRVYKGQPLIAQKMDHGFLVAKALQALRDAVLQGLIGRPGGAGGGSTPVPSSGGGAQGDKGKTGTGGGTTTTPPGPPATPPPPPGGG
jgi:hypothetical protein